MQKYSYITFIFLFHLTFIKGQEALEEKAKSTFENDYTTFISTYQIDKNKSTFKNYSELWARKSLPEELRLMIQYDTTSFYDLYLNHIKNSRDTLIDITGLDLSQDIKDTYIQFKQSILIGQMKNKFNYQKDKLYSEKLIKSLNQLSEPQIGYYQTAIIVSYLPNGQTVENKIIITYTNNLQLIDFDLVQ